MQNDKGAYFLLVYDEGSSERYSNAEAARKAARISEITDPNGTRRLYKCLPDEDPVEIMV